jgi:hypothetical protein
MSMEPSALVFGPGFCWLLMLGYGWLWSSQRVHGSYSVTDQKSATGTFGGMVSL